jgi:hypothetical protein
MNGQQLINEVRNLGNTLDQIEHDYVRLQAVEGVPVQLPSYLLDATQSLTRAQALLTDLAGRQLATEALRAE